MEKHGVQNRAAAQGGYSRTRIFLQGTWNKRTQSHFTSPPLAFKSSTSLLSNVTRFTLEYGEMLSSTM